MKNNALWEHLSASDFKEALVKSKKVCIIPCACYEKHGNHLPLGTDMIIAKNIALGAVEKEYAVIYPMHFYTQVSEVRHQIGTISVKSETQMKLLQEICEEIYRNGFEKIILLNCHGGNGYFLNYFCQTQLDSCKNYSVYAYHIWPLPKHQREELIEKYGDMKILGHGDVDETSLIYAIDESLVSIDKVVAEEGKALNRNTETKNAGLYHALNWYANFPHHLAGNPLPATKEYGIDLLNMQVKNFSVAINKVKADKTMPKLQKEFFTNREGENHE